MASEPSRKGHDELPHRQPANPRPTFLDRDKRADRNETAASSLAWALVEALVYPGAFIDPSGSRPLSASPASGSAASFRR
jgi:hypothetical protein